MYRKGITVGRIAAVCGAVQQTVSRHIRAQRLMHPDMETEHLANRPSGRHRPAGSKWQAKVDAVAAYLEENGRYPTASDPDRVTRRLAHWLSLQRCAHRDGRLSAERHRLMSALPGWANNQRSEEAGERWRARLEELKAFRDGEGRWPGSGMPGAKPNACSVCGCTASAKKLRGDNSDPSNSIGWTPRCLAGTRGCESSHTWARPLPACDLQAAVDFCCCCGPTLNRCAGCPVQARILSKPGCSP